MIPFTSTWSLATRESPCGLELLLRVKYHLLGTVLCIHAPTKPAKAPQDYNEIEIKLRSSEQAHTYIPDPTRKAVKLPQYSKTQ